MSALAPSLPNLWIRLGSMFVRASDVIGAPAALAQLGALTRRRRHAFACWIARLECIARKLIFAEAAALAPEPARAARQASPRAAAAATRTSPSTLDPSQPQTWPARFKLAPPRPPRAEPEERASHAAPTPRTRTQTQRLPAALRLAIRVEALRRVLENPAPHARRLARIFHRLKRTFPEAAPRYALVTARPHASDEGDPRLIVEAMTLAYTAAQIFLNSS